MSSVYDALDEAGVDEDTRKKVLAAYNESMDEQRENDEMCRLRERVSKLEEAVTELRCATMQIPRNYNQMGKLIMDLGV